MKNDPLADELTKLLDALKVEMVISQALIDILVSKGVFSHDELQKKIKEIKIESGIVLSSVSQTGEKPQ